MKPNFKKIAKNFLQEISERGTRQQGMCAKTRSLHSGQAELCVDPEFSWKNIPCSSDADCGEEECYCDFSHDMARDQGFDRNIAIQENKQQLNEIWPFLLAGAIGGGIGAGIDWWLLGDPGSTPSWGGGGTDCCDMGWNWCCGNVRPTDDTQLDDLGMTMGENKQQLNEVIPIALGYIIGGIISGTGTIGFIEWYNDTWGDNVKPGDIGELADEDIRRTIAMSGNPTWIDALKKADQIRNNLAKKGRGTMNLRENGKYLNENLNYFNNLARLLGMMQKNIASGWNSCENNLRPGWDKMEGEMLLSVINEVPSCQNFINLVAKAEPLRREALEAPSKAASMKNTSVSAVGGMREVRSAVKNELSGIRRNTKLNENKGCGCGKKSINEKDIPKDFKPIPTNPNSKKRQSPKPPKACYRIDAGDCIKCPKRECNKKTTPCKFREPTCKSQQNESKQPLNENMILMGLMQIVDPALNWCCENDPDSLCCMWPGSSNIPIKGEGERAMVGVPDGFSLPFINGVIKAYQAKSGGMLQEAKKSAKKSMLNEWIWLVLTGIGGLGTYLGFGSGGGNPGNPGDAECCEETNDPDCCAGAGMVRPKGDGREDAPEDIMMEADIDTRGWTKEQIEDCCAMQMDVTPNNTPCCTDLSRPMGPYKPFNDNDLDIGKTMGPYKPFDVDAIREDYDADRGCSEMFSSDSTASNYEPNCVKCLAAQGGSGSAFDANITGPNCECCEDGVTPEPSDIDRCENCCCEEIDIGVGVCKPGTEVMPNINFPNPKCDCSLIGLIDAPAGTKNCKGPGDSRGTLPTVGVSSTFVGPQISEEVKRFKKLAGIIKG